MAAISVLLNETISPDSSAFVFKYSDVAFACGSWSHKSTLYPCIDNACAIIVLFVVFPVPPLKLPNETFTGVLTKLRGTNGMLIEVPQDNEYDGYQYQLQIIAEYTVEA